MDIQYNLDSMHIFVSKDHEEMIKMPWNIKDKENVAKVDDSFAIRPLIYALNRTEEYLILELGQGKTSLYQAMNDSIIREVENHVFPFGDNPNDTPHNIRRSDAEYMDSLVVEHFRDIDKALFEFYKTLEHPQKIIVISTEDNFSKLKEASQRPELYKGHAAINYVDNAPHHLAEQAWEIVRKLKGEERGEAIGEVKAAISQSNVLTDINEIFRAAKDGRGDLLLIHEEFSQPVRMLDERSFELVEDEKEPGVVDDITSTISWEVISKGGRVVITGQEELKDLGNIALKTRY